MSLKGLVPGVLLFAAFAYVVTFHMDWVFAAGEWIGNMFLAPLAE
ncbi:hypothetical protein [Demequina silvatica]|nr:hypothetical protein [Demequina silvatica]